MREKYESLSLVVLKDLAKARGLKGISTMKKGELIDRMLQEDERKRGSAEGKDGIYRADSFRTGRKKAYTKTAKRRASVPYGGSQPSGAWRKHACRTWSTCITGTDL